ncbi:MULTISPECIES: SagB/ThcOx family dehydrogenase [Sorangium]|uniref:SagB/ThcOx family dehydrogenase n=1 Tax=Sorangium TaxID=39643 RepID=UPI003D9C0396
MKVRCAIGLGAVNTPSGFDLYACHLRGRVFDAHALAEPGLVELLCLCADWQEEQVAVEHLAAGAGASPAAARATIADLVEKGILVTDADPQTRQASDAARERWRSRGWEDAFFYQLETNVRPKLDYSDPGEAAKDVRLMKEHVGAGAPPDNYKILPDRPLLPLGERPALAHLSLAEAFKAPVARSEPSGPLSLEELSWITSLAFGQTHVRRLPVTGAHVAKTSPSGGSRHPTEVYPVVLAVEGVEPGLYHYNVRDNALELLRPGAHLEFVREHVTLHRNRPAFEPKVAYLHATLFERSMFRYRDAFSYRVMHHDLGHLMQTTALLASAVGRSSYRCYALADSAVDELLGIDGIHEAAMTCTLVG